VENLHGTWHDQYSGAQSGDTCPQVSNFSSWRTWGRSQRSQLISQASVWCGRSKSNEQIRPCWPFELQNAHLELVDKPYPTDPFAACFLTSRWYQSVYLIRNASGKRTQQAERLYLRRARTHSRWSLDKNQPVLVYPSLKTKWLQCFSAGWEAVIFGCIFCCRCNLIFICDSILKPSNPSNIDFHCKLNFSSHIFWELTYIPNSKAQELKIFKSLSIQSLCNFRKPG
jgi:hypothetical protein